MNRYELYKEEANPVHRICSICGFSGDDIFSFEPGFRTWRRDVKTNLPICRECKQKVRY